MIFILLQQLKTAYVFLFVEVWYPFIKLVILFPWQKNWKVSCKVDWVCLTSFRNYEIAANDINGDLE